MKSLIVTMAGQSSRFQAEGVYVPKWALKIDKKNVLTRAMESVAPYAQSPDCETIFVSRLDHRARESVERCCEELNIENFRLMELLETPPGQAITASVAVETIDSNSSIVIWNVDTAINGNALINIPSFGSWLSVAQLPGDHWSFADVIDGKVTRTAEKKRISNWASIGLYGFQDPGVYMEALRRSRDSTVEETYIAPIYNQVIEVGHEVNLHFVEAENVVPLGTPQEIIDFCNRSAFDIPLEMKHL